MAEKQNSSDQKISTSAARRRASIPSLSRVFKSQTSSFQRRSANTKPTKVPAKSGGGIKTFIMKVIIGAGAVYFSAILGVWGEPEESTKIAQKVKELITKVGNEKMISEDFKGDLIGKFNDTTTYLKNQIEGIPEELKAYYEKTEKYVNDLIKGKGKS